MCIYEYSLNSFADRVLYIFSVWSVVCRARNRWLVARGPVGPWARGPVGPCLVGGLPGSDLVARARGPVGPNWAELTRAWSVSVLLLSVSNSKKVLPENRHSSPRIQPYAMILKWRGVRWSAPSTFGGLVANARPHARQSGFQN